MKKNYSLLSGLILMSSVGFAQGLIGNHQASQATPKLTQSETMPIAKSAQQKAYGDTILYVDFATSIPAGWTAANNSANSNDWVWAAGGTAPGGQFSTNTAALNSPSASNGYMLLPADLYNTPIPPGGAVAMDAYFESPSINLLDGNNQQRSSVYISWVHSQRYCCSSANELVVEVSPDGTTWTTYDATGGRGANTATPNGEQLTVNVSAGLANQNSGYVRFRSTGNSHYYWMIDDVLLFEGPENAMELSDWTIKFHSSYFYTPIYTILPQSNMPVTTFTGFTTNQGGSTQTNVDFNVDAIMDSAIGGGPGNGLAYSASTSIGSQSPLALDTADVLSPFFTFSPGNYRYNMYVTSDSINQIPSGSVDNYGMAVTLDTTIALENGPAAYSGTTGPPGYVGGGQDGDALAALMIIDSVSPANVMATSISYWVPTTRPSVEGLQISPRVWPWHEDSATLGAGIRPAVASSPFSTTIDTTMFGSWISIPFFPPVALAPGAYYFGLEQTGGGVTNNAELWAGRDVAQEAIAPDLSTVFFLNEGSNPRWGWSDIITGIRFNGMFTVGVEEEQAAKVDFNVYPNPNNGLFTLKVSSSVATTYTMNVRNMVGQTVMSEAINVNGNAVKQMDLSNFDKGVYFVSLENGDERLVRKVVVK